MCARDPDGMKTAWLDLDATIEKYGEQTLGGSSASG
jgi:hypothetical protein